MIAWLGLARLGLARFGPRWPRVFVLLLLPWLLVSAPAQARDVPVLSGRVVDEAGVLTDARVRRLEQRLASHEERTGQQLVVLTVASLEGEPIEAFSIRVVEQWQLGRAGHDGGLLMVLAVEDREARIEVGYGLEGEVTDLLSARIIHEVMRPQLRRGRHDAAIEEGMDALMLAAGAEPPPATEPVESAGPSVWQRRFAGQTVLWYALMTLVMAAVFGMCWRWPLLGVVALLTTARLWWPGALVCIGALWLRWRSFRRRRRRDGYGVARPPRTSAGGLRSFLWKLGGLTALLGLGRLLGSRTGRGMASGLARRIGGGGDGDGGFVGGGGRFGGGGASGGW